MTGILAGGRQDAWRRDDDRGVETETLGEKNRTARGLKGNGDFRRS